MKKIQFSEKDINAIIDLYQDGMYQKDIAQMYNVSKSTIARLIQGTDLPSKHPLLTEERKRQIIDCYQQCKSMAQTAKMMHCSEITVKQICNEVDVYTYTLSEAKRRYTINESYFNDINTHNKAYFLGLLYADGCVASNTNCVSISLQESDVAILKSLKAELGYDGPLYYIDYQSKNTTYKNQYRLSIVCKRLHDDLIANGCIPCKSLTLNFPACLKPIYYSSFLLGYLDGDGNIAKNEHRCSFVGTDKFCMKAKEIIEYKLGIHCTVYTTHDSNQITKTLSIAGRNQVKIFLDWLYSANTYCLDRKKNIYLSNYYNAA